MVEFKVGDFITQSHWSQFYEIVTIDDSFYYLETSYSGILPYPKNMDWIKEDNEEIQINQEIAMMILEQTPSQREEMAGILWHYLAPDAVIDDVSKALEGFVKDMLND